MAIEAPISKFKKNGLKIYIVVCLAAAMWLGYDGYLNEEFREKHVDADGKPDSILVINQKGPVFLIGAAVLLGGYLLALKNKKLIADENELVFSDKEKIAYDSIQKIDKTHFDSKGHFILTYKNENNKEVDRKINKRRYDNLAAVLDHLVDQLKNSNGKS